MLPVLFRIGPITLHTYGLMVATGFLIGLAAGRRTFIWGGLPPSLLDRLSVALVVCGILGARIMYFAVDHFAALSVDPLSFFRIWEGGLVFYGGVVGALIAVIWFSARNRLPLLALTDALAPPLLIGHSLGRLGCFAAGCCFGKPSGGWPGVVFTDPASLAPLSVRLHPVQLYESAVLLFLFLAAFKWASRRPPVGRMSAAYLSCYGVARFLLEFLRGDDRGQAVFGLSPGQFVSIIMVAAGVFLFMPSRRHS